MENENKEKKPNEFSAIAWKPSTGSSSIVVTIPYVITERLKITENDILDVELRGVVKRAKKS